MELELKKDQITQKALEEILSLKLEGHLFNKDHIGYWELLNETLMKTSIGSFRDGISEFYKAIETHDNKKELITYDLCLLTRLSNNKAVMSSSDSLYAILSTQLLDYNHIDIEYDLIINKSVVQLTTFEKIFLFMYVYNDTIDMNFLEYLNKFNGNKNRNGMKIR